jgi:hypothetical protein
VASVSRPIFDTKGSFKSVRAHDPSMPMMACIAAPTSSRADWPTSTLT